MSILAMCPIAEIVRGEVAASLVPCRDFTMLGASGSAEARAGQAEMGDVRRKQAGPDPLKQNADLAGKGGKIGQIDTPPQYPGHHPGQP